MSGGQTGMAPLVFKNREQKAESSPIIRGETNTSDLLNGISFLFRPYRALTGNRALLCFILYCPFRAKKFDSLS
jgi:hypothetical protein